jgi:hypothetical protein
MREKTLLSMAAMLIASLLAGPAAFAEDALPPVAKLTGSAPPTVYLRGPLDLEKLKDSNLDHYTRAQRIMAAADEICKPGPYETHFAGWAAKDVSCMGQFLRTSFPAKREIGFTLDGVRYVALVDLNDSDAQLRQVPGHLLEPAN